MGPATRADGWIGGEMAPDAPGPAWTAARFAGAGVPAAVLGSGREALAHLLSAVGARGRAVLIPAYGCAALAQAVRLAGASPRFYPGDAQLRPEADGLRRGLRDPDVAAWVLVHPFGWLQEPPGPAGGSRALLLEDTSHTLCNGPGARFLGDPAAAGLAASLRKCLPVAAGFCARTDGGELPAPAGRPSPATAAFSAARAEAWAESDPWRRHARLGRAEDLLDPFAPAAPAGGSGALGPPGGRAVPARRATGEAAPREGPPAAPPAGALVRLAALAACPQAACAAWRARCRANWQALADGLRGAPGFAPFHPELPTGVCPLGFVVRHPDRGALAARLQRRGVVATLHWPVPPEARAFLTRAERMLSGTILTLPCDARYSASDMARVARAVHEEVRA